MHPDVKDRTVQAVFSIAGLAINPNIANVTMARGRTQDIPVTLQNYGGGQAKGDVDAHGALRSETAKPQDNTMLKIPKQNMQNYKITRWRETRPSGQLSTVIDPNGNTTTNTYDGTEL